MDCYGQGGDSEKGGRTGGFQAISTHLVDRRAQQPMSKLARHNQKRETR